ncbi:MAG TPA: DUF3618 domain-containing protein [Thermomicrobiales bacterium]|jgi:hypothetical protein
MGQSANSISRSGHSGANADDIAVTPETEELRREIEHTRTDMSGTLDAIQQRLNPEVIGEQAKDTASDITAQAKEAALEVVDHALAEVKGQATEVIEQAREVLAEARMTAREVLDEAKVTAREAVEDATTNAKAAVRGATIGKVETMIRSANDTTNAARHGLVDTIKANPIPAALAGLGLGWLFINSRSAAARGTTHAHAYEATYREQRPYPSHTPPQFSGYQGNAGSTSGGSGIGSTVNRAQTAAGNLAGQVGGAVGGAAGQVGETASNIASGTMETAGNIVGQVGETASNLASGTVEVAGNIAEQAQYQAMRLEDSFQSALRTNPLAVGAVTLALGTAIGLALPQTQRENQLMGEARDTLLERAQGFAQETVEKVQTVATEAQHAATETVKQEAKSQGLTQ